MAKPTRESENERFLRMADGLNPDLLTFWSVLRVNLPMEMRKIDYERSTARTHEAEFLGAIQVDLVALPFSKFRLNYGDAVPRVRLVASRSPYVGWVTINVFIHARKAHNIITLSLDRSYKVREAGGVMTIGPTAIDAANDLVEWLDNYCT